MFLLQFSLTPFLSDIFLSSFSLLSVCAVYDGSMVHVFTVCLRTENENHGNSEFTGILRTVKSTDIDRHLGMDIHKDIDVTFRKTQS